MIGIELANFLFAEYWPQDCFRDRRSGTFIRDDAIHGQL